MPGARRRPVEVSRDRGLHARKTEVAERHDIRFVVSPTGRAPTHWMVGPRTRAEELTHDQRNKLVERLEEVGFGSFANAPGRFRFALAKVTVTGEPGEGKFVGKDVPQVFVLDREKGSQPRPLSRGTPDKPGPMLLLLREGVPGLFEPSKPLKGRQKAAEEKK